MMKLTQIMSEEMIHAVEREISVMEEVIKNYDPNENYFDLDDYRCYHNDLINLLEWKIPE